MLQPLVHAELIPDVAALEDQKLRVELLLELALPLEGEIGGADDEDALGQAAQLELADEQPGHDGLSGAGIVGEEEAHPGQLQKVVVDGLELVGQGIHAGDRKAEVRVELVGDAERIR